MANVYDAMIFYNEIDMLELRLNVLDPVVDFFVICEAGETHSGKPKPYNFAANQDRFARYLRKIIYVQVDDLTGPGRNSWERERYHRARIADGLTDAGPDDLVIVSDTDEIANPDAIRQLIDTDALGAMLELQFHYYNFNCRVQQGWAIGAMRWGLEHDPNRIRTGEGHDFPHIANGGWHASYFATPEQVIDKVNAFMHHADVAKDLPRDPAYIGAKMATCEDLYGRDLAIDRVPLSDTLPHYVLANIDHYRALGWIVE